MRHADQRYAFGKIQLPSQDFGRARHLIETATVEPRRLRGAQQFQTFRRFFQHGAGQRARQRGVIPGGQPRVDVRYIPSDAAQRINDRIDRCARIFGGVLVTGETFFFVVDDEARTTGLRHLDQRYARVMRAGCAEAGEINCLAA
jgi:hypothetical protein